MTYKVGLNRPSREGLMRANSFFTIVPLYVTMLKVFGKQSKYLLGSHDRTGGLGVPCGSVRCNKRKTFMDRRSC